MNYKNRQKVIGNRLEQMIEQSNNIYLRKGIALVQQIPVPITVKRNKGNIITHGYFKEKSTVDFIGLYQGKGICFDTKAVVRDKRFPMSNIAAHQVEYMKKYQEHGGISFLLIDIMSEDKIFRVGIDPIVKKWNLWKDNPGKRGYGSFNLEELEKIGTVVKSGRGCIVDYLKGL